MAAAVQFSCVCATACSTTSHRPLLAADVCCCVQLIETGTTADYLEDWRLLPSSQGDTFAFRLSDSSARTGVLLVAGQHFMFVADRQQPLAASGADPDQHALHILGCLPAACCCALQIDVKAYEQHTIYSQQPLGRQNCCSC